MSPQPHWGNIKSVDFQTNRSSTKGTSSARDQMSHVLRKFDMEMAGPWQEQFPSLWGRNGCLHPED